MCCKMKLDQALKLYIGLYCACFMFSWFVSVPMLMHVSRDGECLLFVTPWVTYGPAGTCWLSGFAFLAIGIAAAILFVLHIMQLTSLRRYLRQPGPHSSKDYHSRPTRVFWPMVVFHGTATLAVLAVTAIIASGYATSCQNMHLDVSKNLRHRQSIPGNQGNQINAAYDQYADFHSIQRYTNPSYRDPYGDRISIQYITCRKIFTDWENTRRLKENRNKDPATRRFWGNSQDTYQDVGNIRYFTWRNNMILELSLAGSVISFVLWSVIFILMITLRQHLKAHLTDESMWGSQWGGQSRRSASKMSNHSFDQGSRISYQSGSRYSAGRGGYHPRGSANRSFPDQMSYQGSLQGGPVRPKHLTPNYKAPPQVSSNGSAQRPQQHSRRSQERNAVPTNHDSSLLKYFAENPPVEEEVDIDAALNDKCLDEVDVSGNYHQNCLQDPDTSFGSEGLPPGLDNTMNGLTDPIPLGDEVSEGRLSEARDVPIFTSNDVSRRPRSPRNELTVTVTGRSRSPSPIRHGGPSTVLATNPNRVTGRRGGRSGANSSSHARPETVTVTQQYSRRTVQQETLHGKFARSPASNAVGYQTQLGNQSLI